MLEKKVNHNYKCQVCGAPATINGQENWVIYGIDKDGDFTELDSTNTGDNEFYCDKCYNKEYNEVSNLHL